MANINLAQKLSNIDTKVLHSLQRKLEEKSRLKAELQQYLHIVSLLANDLKRETSNWEINSISVNDENLSFLLQLSVGVSAHATFKGEKLTSIGFELTFDPQNGIILTSNLDSRDVLKFNQEAYNYDLQSCLADHIAKVVANNITL